jgi:hypothetical protein
MNKSIYKLSFSLSSFQLNDEYEKLSDYEKERISELDADSFFDYEENDKYICFIITTPEEMKKYISILSNNLIWVEPVDISLDVLSFKIDLIDDLGSKISPLSSIKFSFFIDDVEDWILDNLEIDMVLDRISDVGIKNLKQVEKDFLNNFNQNL